MADASIDLRRRAVAAYESGQTESYEETAEVFGVGRASISRWLRRHRETGDVEYKERGGNNPRRVDLNWLQAHCRANPDARIDDRVKALQEHSGEVVSRGAMWGALHAIGWSFKKKRPSPGRKTSRSSKPNGKPSSRSNQG